ncbi:MAG: hypothetical protein HC915_20150 [Anaerolineae bacterium]|nr:hypothetical protein [Anaerolineae bacterium]
MRDVLVQGGRPVALSSNPLGVLNARRVLEGLGRDEALLTARLAREGNLPQTRYVVPVPRQDFLPIPPSGVDRLTWWLELGYLEPQVPGGPPPLESPADYVVLPYLSGGAVGVRALASPSGVAPFLFARDALGETTEFEVGALDDGTFAFLIVIGEDAEDLRIWAEQLSGVNLPTFALTTAAAEPAARPYLESGAYEGLLSGIRGAARYDAARNSASKAPYTAPDALDLPDPALSRWHSLVLGVLVAVMLISLGTVVNVLRGLIRGLRGLRNA